MPKPTKHPDSAELVERDERAPLMREGTVRIVPREEVAARAAGDAPAIRAEDGEDGEDEIEIAISSESAVERYDWMTGRTYKEILGHGAGEIDLSYAKDGLPFFVNHSSRDMVGLIEDVRLDPDRVLRGRVRFSKSARAAEIRQDILDGIRKKISVGYDYPEDNYTEKAENDELSRRYTGWRPLEASSVPIPADYEVGVGRSARPGARRPDDLPGPTASKAKEHTMGTEAQPAADAGVVRAQVAAEHAEIVALAKQHKLEDRLADWIGGQASVEQVRKDVLEHYKQKADTVVTRSGQGKVLDLSNGDEKRYSFARAIQSAAAGENSFEREVSEELYKKLGKRRSRENAMLVPTELLGRSIQQRSRLAVATSGAGQQLQFPEYGGFLDILRNRMYVGRFGATFLSGLQGNLSFVTKPSTNTFQWGAETANPTATNFGTGLRTMSPKNGQALTAYTRQLLAQSVESIEQLVQDDLLGICAVALDAAAIVAGGGSAPVGILGTTGIGSVAMGTNGGAATFATFVDLWTQIATDNADAAAMKYLTTVGVAGAMQKTQQFSGTNGVPVWSWDGGAGPGEGRVNGHVAAATNQVSSNLTKGTSTAVCHAAVFGDWPSLVVGEWGAVEILVDPYSSKMAIIEVGLHVMADICLRYPEKFSACLDITV